MQNEPLRIGNGQGFWGDSIDAPIKLVRGGPLHYLTLDYLAEVTMSILQRQRQRDPERGYAHDFVTLIGEILPDIVEKNIKVIANAGGVNARACQRAVMRVARDAGFSGIKVGIVEGDDILSRIPELVISGESLSHLDTGESIESVREKLLSANAYIGARPICDALAAGAQIIVTGRVADPSMVLGALMHEFGWPESDWNLLASGTVAGHILECGAQVTGGNYSRWREVPDMANIGYPIVDAFREGTFEVTKHPGTGGLVDNGTVSEQLLYEIGDPNRYVSPDVVVDFTSILLKEVTENRVRISGVEGAPPTDSFKVSASYDDGFKATGMLTVSGPDAYDKARKCGEIIWRRLIDSGCDFEETLTEFLGANSCHGRIVQAPEEANEVVLRVSARDSNKDKLERFAKEIAPLVTNGPPGVTGYAGGRPKPQQVVAYWPALIKKEFVSARVSVEEV
jgi:hypothetical protein